MRYGSFAFGLLCAALAGTPAAAQSAAGTDTTIRTTILIRSKASECPPDFTVFQMDSSKKLPRAAKICFVRAPKPVHP
jgi:hypothetical protein